MAKELTKSKKAAVLILFFLTTAFCILVGVFVPSFVGILSAGVSIYLGWALLALMALAVAAFLSFILIKSWVPDTKILPTDDPSKIQGSQKTQAKKSETLKPVPGTPIPLKGRLKDEKIFGSLASLIGTDPQIIADIQSLDSKPSYENVAYVLTDSEFLPEFEATVEDWEHSLKMFYKHTLMDKFRSEQLKAINAPAQGIGQKIYDHLMEKVKAYAEANGIALEAPSDSLIA